MASFPPQPDTPLVDNEPDRFFSTEHLKADLKGYTVRGGTVMVVSQGLRFTLMLGGMMVLGRLLSPEEYGLVGMVMAITGLVLTFKDLGVSMAAIQRPRITHVQMTNLFWFNVAVALGAAVITFGMAPLITRFYGDVRLVAVTQVLSVGFLLSGFASLHQALLRRQMRFKRLALVDLLASAFSLAVAVIAACLGASYWALVLQSITFPFAAAMAAWLLCSWRPGLPKRGGDTFSLLATGSNTAAASLLGYISVNFDKVVLGKIWGPVDLGNYIRGFNLVKLPMSQVNPPLTAIMIPALSQLADRPDQYRRAFLRVYRPVNMLIMPLTAYMIASSDWLILAVLGPNWVDAAPIFAVLGVWGLTAPFGNMISWLLLSQDRSKDLLLSYLIGTVARILAITAAVTLGRSWGVLGVSAAFSIESLVVQVPVLFWLAQKSGPVRAGHLSRSLAAPAVASGLILALTTALRLWHPVDSQYLLLALATALSTGVLAGTVMASPGERQVLRDLLEMVLSRHRARPGL